MSACRKFVLEELRQAGMVFSGLLLLGLSALVLFLYSDVHGSATTGLLRAVGIVIGLTAAFAASLLSGPVPTLLTLYDISDRQLLILSCFMVVPYWVCLGAAAGFLRWKKDVTDAGQSQVGLPKRVGKQIRWTLEIAAMIIATAFFRAGPIAGPTYVSSGRFSAGFMRNSIINNLRQIDGAKQQLALEKKLSADHLPTEAELAPYFHEGTNFFHRPACPVRYVLNPIAVTPYAVLDSDWRFRRRGWNEGFTIRHGTVYRLE